MPNFIDDEMTEQDWEEYSHKFEARYNEHFKSIKTSGSRRVGRSTASSYYDEEDGLGNLLPTEEEINRYRRSLMPDPVEIISSMIRPPTKTQWLLSFWRASGNKNLTFSKISDIIYM